MIALGALATCGLLTAPARADWRVDGRDRASWAAAAARALVERPQQPGLAETIARTAGRADLPRIVARVCRAAPGAPEARDAGAQRRDWACARLLLAAGRAGEAAAALARVAPARPSPALLRDRLRLAKLLRDREAAIAALRALVALAPSSSLRLELMEILHDDGRDDEALALAQELGAGSRGTTRRRALETAADILRRRGEHAGALAALRALEGIEPCDAGRTARMVELSSRLEEQAAADAILDRALRVCVRDADELAALADLAARRRDDARTLRAFTALAATAPGDERAWLGLGEAHFQAGRHELARRAWTRAVRRVRPTAAARLRLAEILADHDLADAAIVELRAALTADPRSRDAHLLLARTLERRRRDDDAIAAWSTVLSLAGGDAAAATIRREARAHLVSLYAAQGPARLRDEAAALARRVQENRADRDATLLLAEVEVARGDPSTAVAVLERARATDAADLEIANALVRLLRQSLQPRRALVVLRDLAARLPERARDVLPVLAETELESGDRAAALSTLARARSWFAEDPERLLRLAALEERAGDVARAAETLEAAVRLGARRAVVSRLRLALRAGDIDGALRVLEAIPDDGLRGDEGADIVRHALLLAELRGDEERRSAWLARALVSDDGAVLDAAAAWVARAALGASLAAAPEHARAAGLRILARVLAGAAKPGEPERSLVLALARHAAPELAPPGAAAAALRLLRAAPGSLGPPALAALGRLSDPEVVPALLHALDDRDPEIAGQAAGALATAAARPEVRDRLLAIAVEARAPVPVRRAALYSLARASTRDVDERIADLLPDVDAALADAVALAVARGAPSAWSASLLRAALAGDPETAPAAARGLMALATRADERRLAAVEEAVARTDPADPGAAQAAFLAAATGADAAAWIAWIAQHRAAIADLVDERLRAGGRSRAAALAALRGDGPLDLTAVLSGLDDQAPRAPSVERLRRAVQALADDADDATRLAALGASTRARLGEPSAANLVWVLSRLGARPADEAAGAARTAHEIFARLRAAGADDGALLAALRPVLTGNDRLARLLAADLAGRLETRAAAAAVATAAADPWVAALTAR